MRILWLTSAVPYPPNAGLPIREYNLMKRIGKKHEITLLTFIREKEDEQKLECLKDIFTDIFTVESISMNAFSRPLKFFTYLFSGRPPDLRFYYYQDMADIIRRLLDTDTYDVFHIDDTFMAEYICAVPDNINCKKVVSIIDIVYRKLDRIYRIEPKRGRKFRLWLFWFLMRKWEPKILEEYDQCLTMSEIDSHILLKDNPNLKLSVVPNGVTSREVDILPEREITPSLIYVGNMEYRPNADAVIYMCHDILPELKEQYKTLEFWIVGKNPSEAVLNLKSEYIHVTGEVDDVVEYYERCNICVVPLRAGGGTRLKILEAMSLGRPVISSSVGCEGIEVQDGENILIANTPAEFQKHIRTLCEDEGLRKQLILNAKKLVNEKYDWDIIAEQKIQIFSKLLQ